MRNAYENLVGKPEGNIIMEGFEWMHLAQDRNQWRTVVNTVMNL
jgi:hypothetical protein